MSASRTGVPNLKRRGMKMPAATIQKMRLSKLGKGMKHIPKDALEADIRVGLTIYEMKAKYGVSRNNISRNCITYWGLSLEFLRRNWGCRLFRGNQWTPAKV